MDYYELLINSYKKEKEEHEDRNKNGIWPNTDYEYNRLEYLSDYIFDFTTYDSEMSIEFAKDALVVCNAITKEETYEYIQNKENYKNYLIMCNMPFFSKNIDWGTSIRGAFWSPDNMKIHEFSSCGIWDGDRQIGEGLKFTDEDEWEEFILAIIKFSIT